ncbi:beta-propeller domain-containing protein [Massilia sp. DJPM01]|uniref:beta-propeller domain-containing protein n=1 Tax=Massilia sp. DJPM01 TaxID=3024404 RepID=UPI00259ED89E|nr:beta-propeller domain-containing protein [Massilia sp. DJPM01]MDM5177847.1 beta-propeller domain-containing protein [Massilia sp. DJPM01]
MQRLSSKHLSAGLTLCLALFLSACGGSSAPQPTPEPVPPPSAVLSGRTSFVSADSGANQSTLGLDGTLKPTVADSAVPPAATPVAAAPTRTVQEGDIFRMLENGKSILSLNRFRGLQIIDISNTASPRVVGRAAINGEPVEMYRVGNRVYILLNNWTEYKRIAKGGAESLDQFSGGAVITVDIADLAAPKIMATARVPGNIDTSRLTSGAGKNALYVTASDYTASVMPMDVMPATSSLYYPAVSKTHVLSYRINEQGQLISKSTLQLGGNVQAVQASGDRLMVARAADDLGRQSGSRVALIDISSPDGVMVQGADVGVSGLVQKKTNMHMHGDVLRVVSGNWWSSGANVNHVETFNMADIGRPKPIDHDTFGAGQQLFGTSFFADKAFFVTYLRKDPFHAFSITPDGTMKEESEFIVSGWNDFFMPVHNQTRLIGVGHNDENDRRSLAISLYDVTDLKNTKPLLMRADVDLANSWSQANWDDRAFTVLENAANAIAPDGKTRETGLILLPFAGFNANTRENSAGVQIFTFSASTVTRRGIMKQDTEVRRSFMGDTANDLAANLSDSELSLFSIVNADSPQVKGRLPLAPNYGQFVLFKNVNVRYHVNDNQWWSSTAARTDQVELVPLADPDGAAPLSSITVPSNAKLYNVAEKLVVVSSAGGNDGTVNTTITTYDLADAAKPVRLGSLTTTELAQTNIYPMMGNTICPMIGPCGGWYGTPDATVVGNALVFATQVTPILLRGPQPAAALAMSSLPYGYYSSSYTLHVLDLSKPAQPVLLPKIAMAENEQAVGLVKSGNAVWVNYKQAEAVTSSGQAQAKYFVKALDVSNASAPKLGSAINVPGRVMAVVGDVMYTVDESWGDKTVTNSVNMLIVRANLAYLQASLALGGQYARDLSIEGKNLVLALAENGTGKNALAVIEVGSQSLTRKATLDVPFYPMLHDAGPGKVLVQAGYGFLLYDVSTAAPFAQAFFPTANWGGQVSVLGKDMYVPANAYGIYQFNLDTVNLSKP